MSRLLAFVPLCTVFLPLLYRLRDYRRPTSNCSTWPDLGTDPALPPDKDERCSVLPALADTTGNTLDKTPLSLDSVYRRLCFATSSPTQPTPNFPGTTRCHTDANYRQQDSWPLGNADGAATWRRSLPDKAAADGAATWRRSLPDWRWRPTDGDIIHRISSHGVRTAVTGYAWATPAPPNCWRPCHGGERWLLERANITRASEAVGIGETMDDGRWAMGENDGWRRMTAWTPTGEMGKGKCVCCVCMRWLIMCMWLCIVFVGMHVSCTCMYVWCIRY